MRIRLYPLVASVVLLASAVVPRLFGQTPTLVSVAKQFSYEQSVSDGLSDYQPELQFSVTFRGNLSNEPVVKVNTPDGTFTLQRVIGTGPTNDFPQTEYVYLQRFASNAALAAALASSTVTFTVNGAGQPTSITPAFSIYAHSAPSLITNFTALQTWNGSNLKIAWTPVLADSLQFSLKRPDGTFAVQFVDPTLADKTGLSNYASLDRGASSFDVPGFVSAAGDIFYGELLASDTFTPKAASDVTMTLTGSITTLRFAVRRPGIAPLITTQPQSLSAIAGTNVTLSVTATGTGLTYLWKKDGNPIPSATSATLNLNAVRSTDSGVYTVSVSGSGGSLTSTAATLTVVAANIAPTVSTAPANLTVVAGAKSTLSVTAAGTAPFTYQWLRNGAPLTGATSSTYTLDPTLVSDAAAYAVTITNSAGSVTSSAATLAVTAISRISNLSVLTSLSAPADNFTLGYVVGGANTAGAKPLLLRAAGPALGALGVAGTLDDPKLELFAGSAKTSENDNWAGASALVAAFTAVGAFPFPSPNSHDAATTANLSTRDNSVKISAATNGTGLVLAEIYDATPSAGFTSATPRLLNVSVLKSLGTGLTVGFTLAGSSPKAVLIRAIGPTLGDFGLSGAVVDPQLTLFASGATAPLATNDNWSGTPALTAAFASVGAFALDPAAKDAALLATLPPGGYSVQVSGVNHTTGTALVEIYEVP